jgi:hypothetical protein
MLDNKRIDQIATEVATANLTPQNFTSVQSSSTTDSTGEEALQIRIIIPPGAALRIEGHAPLVTLVQIQDRLREAGENRFPIIEYSTQQELTESGDS